MENQIIQVLESEACKVENTDDSIIFYLDNSKVHYLKDFYSLSRNVEFKSVDKENRATLVIDNGIHSTNNVKMRDLNFIGHFEIKASAHFYAINCNFEPHSESDNSVIDVIAWGQSIFCNCHFKGGKHSSIVGRSNAKILIYYSIFDNCRSAAISATECEMQISNCTFSSSERFAIFLDKGSNFSIQKSVFKGIKGKAIVCTRSSVCDCTDCDFVQIENDAITVTELSKAAVKECIFSDITHSCIIARRDSNVSVSKSSANNCNNGIIFSNSTGFLNSNYFNNIKYASLYISGLKSNPYIVNIEIHNTQDSPAVIITDCAVPTIESILIDNVQSHGFTVSDFAQPLISNTTIKNVSQSAFCISNGALIKTNGILTENCKYDYESYTQGKMLKCDINHQSNQDSLKTNIHHGGMFTHVPARIPIWGPQIKNEKTTTEEVKNEKIVPKSPQEEIDQRNEAKQDDPTVNPPEGTAYPKIGEYHYIAKKEKVKSQMHFDTTKELLSHFTQLRKAPKSPRTPDDQSPQNEQKGTTTQQEEKENMQQKEVQNENNTEIIEKKDDEISSVKRDSTDNTPNEETIKTASEMKSSEETKSQENDNQTKSEKNTNFTKSRTKQNPLDIQKRHTRNPRSEGFPDSFDMSKFTRERPNRNKESSVSKITKRNVRAPNSFSLTRTYGTVDTNTSQLPSSAPSYVSKTEIFPKEEDAKQETSPTPNKSLKDFLQHHPASEPVKPPEQSSNETTSIHDKKEHRHPETLNRQTNSFTRTMSRRGLPRSYHQEQPNSEFSNIHPRTAPLSFSATASRKLNLERNIHLLTALLEENDLKPNPENIPVRTDRSSFKFIEESKREATYQNPIDIDKMYESELLGSIDEDEKVGKCLVCGKETEDLLICAPCGHKCVCKDCKEKIMSSDKKLCPLCSTRITDIKLPFKSDNCLICMDSPADTLFMPCFHQCACYKCASQLWQQTKKCPECSNFYSSFKHVFNIPEK